MPSTSSDPGRRATRSAPRRREPDQDRPSPRRPAGRRAAALAAAALCAASCTFVPAPAQPRPALPAPPQFAAAARHVEPPQLDGLRDEGGGRSKGILRGSGEIVEFELWRTPHDGARRPLVLLVPILAGGAELMEQIGIRVQAHGFDVAFCARAGAALKPPQRTRELDELFRRTVLHQRMLLALLRATPELAPPALFVLGVSMGGMVTTAVAALEPDLDGVAICLAGGDLAHMVPISGEPRVQAWTEWRQREDGVGRDHLHWELASYLRFEPIVLGACVATEKVLFVSAQFDDVVPRRHQDVLWEALGRPARLVVPLGHYTAALAIDPIVAAVADHFRARPPAAKPPR
jgi:pimeloyl-ACP methyl ester carboxylesterase